MRHGARGKRGRKAKPGPTKLARKRQPRRPGAALKARALEILARLKAEYPDAKCALDHRTPYQLLVATILSAQCTDVRVNLTTPALFARYPTAKALAGADPAEVEELIRSTGFFRNKTRSLIGMAQVVSERHGGEVPRAMESLRVLPGVGRKTANVVLGNAFGINEGVVVDTHVTRLSRLLRLTNEDTAERIEPALMSLVPREEWTLAAHLLIFHGRRVCIARRPRCAQCVLQDLCPSSQA